MRALINFDVKVNAITQVYILELSLKIRQTNIGDPKIDNSIFETFQIILASF